MPTSEESIARRIREKTNRSAGAMACHPWTGNFGQFGGPALSVVRANGAKGGGSARRMLWELTHGPLEKTRRVRVTCGNLSCMNLAHMTLEPVKDPEPRFWKNVNRHAPNGCWEWTATRYVRSRGQARVSSNVGYGMFMVTALKRVFAHRYSWELHNGPIPAGMFVCHHCDNPPCCNPAHLFLGTNTDNVHDMIAKGRNSRGEKHAAAVRAGRERASTSAQTGPK